MWKKLIAALLAAIIFNLLLAYLAYVPEAERDYNSYYFSFWDSVVMYSMYSVPVYIIGGIPSSIVIEKLLPRSHFKSKFSFYLSKFSAYGLSGLIVMLLFLFFLIITSGQVTIMWNELLTFLVIGVIASLIYFHVYIIVDNIKRSA